MAASRLKIIARLGLLLGLPISAVLGLFAGGLYTGAQHRHAVLSFEDKWLGRDVQIPDPPVSPSEDTPTPVATDADSETTTDARGAQAGAAPASPEPALRPAPAGQNQNQGEAPAPTSAPTSAPTPAPTPEPGPIPAPAGAQADPAEGSLAARLALPVTVAVKVVVDPELIAAREDWIDYTQRTVSEASLVYEKQFGIELELVGVGRWLVATAGVDSKGLVEQLKRRSREGADVLVGLTNRPLDGNVGGRSETPAPNSPFNGAHAVVYARPNQERPHLRTLLHELGHLFGAEDITDPQHTDYQAGSWMSYAPVPAGRAPWIDTANRQRILDRKDKPFAPEKRGGR